MTVTVPQAVRILSKGKYTIGPEGTISSEDYALLDELIAEEVSRKDPGFTATDLVRYKAYLILDILSNTGGTGFVTEKKVNLVSWKISKSDVKGSTSLWYDYAEKMISEYGKNTMPAGVSRSDAYFQGFDSNPVDVSGDPANSERPGGW
ncbi:MAG: hypothetical protein PHN69_04075 [Candidatus Pacebacteria bacterium]|nr:hypothetical protein [Fermentimonas sp.]MDD4804330.1 hypothetical protein [Candidatus Paceibacterota bacterium]